MNLTTKINLILAAAFLVGLSLVGVNSYLLTEDNALQQVTDQAELIMQEAVAVRTYTINEVRPKLGALADGEFHEQTVPAYAATQTANLVREQRPNFSYKEAVFNPTNPRDRATPDEEKIIEYFISNSGQTRLVGELNVEGVRSLYIAHPIRITNPACLACHSTPEAAPPAMIAKYGDQGGFGWQLNEIIGTQIVLAPYTLPAQLAEKTFVSFLVSMATIFLILFLVINITIRKLVLKPVMRVTRQAEAVSKGNLKESEIKVTGKDEIADMSRAFNRMRRSLIKVVQMMRKAQAEAKGKA